MVMPRRTFDRKLRELQDAVFAMGEMVEEAIGRSIEALRNQDMEAARQVIANDLLINQERLDIEQRCIDLIATQQPAATDLRIIVAVLSIIVDLERMADHAEGIAKITLMIGDAPLPKPLIDIPRMAEKASDMLRRSLVTFRDRDVEEARRICAEDDEVDALYDQVYRELVFLMIQDPRIIGPATHLLWVAHNLERIADRATNICERAVFTVSGKMEEIASKY